jgi:hypothetical protein
MFHQNSRRVTVYMNPSFLSGAQTPEVQAYLATGNESVGAYFENRDSTLIGTGLSIEEKKYLLPELLGVSSEDRDFIKLLNEYYSGLSTKIPYEQGKTLEIGLDTDNSKPLFIKDKDGKMTFKQWPINLSDYLRYRHIKGHPFVAEGKDKAVGNVMKQFYIYDDTLESIVDSKLQDTKDEATALYLTISKEKDKIDQMITLLGKDPRDVGREAERKAYLKGVSEKEPKTFIDTYHDKNFELTYWAKTFVNAGIWETAGVSRIVNREDKKLIGNTMTEVIAWMQDKENQELINVFKSNAQEAMKAIRKKNNKIVR